MPSPAWPPGDGEMARRIRAHDWAATPLGPVERWPRSLRITVDLLLAHPFPICVHWGADLIQLYNDAYAELIFGKHPASLGRPLHEQWPEVRPSNQPLMERVRAGETVQVTDGLYCKAKRGAIEDGWYTAAYSPVRDDGGGIGGVLVTVFETTARVLAERRRDQAADKLKASEERQAFLLRLADALRPLADAVEVQGEACRLLAEHLDVDRAYYVEVDEAARVARVEQDFVREGAPSLAGEHRIADFGWSVEILRRGECHVISDTRTSALVPVADRPAAAALAIVACMGAPLIKGGRLVGALCVTDARPRDWAEREVELLREVAERTWAAAERGKVEAALRGSEERYRTAQRVGRIGSWETDLAAGIRHWSPEAMELFGLDLPGGKGQAGGEGDEWCNALHPGEHALPAHVYGTLAAQDRLQVEYRIVRPDGRLVWLSGHAEVAERDADGRVTRLVNVVADITESRLAQEALREREAELARVQRIGRVGGLEVDLRDGFRNRRSPEYLRLHGLPPEAAGEPHDDWAARLHPEDREAAERRFFDAVASDASDYEAEYRIVRPSDGAVRWIAAKGEIERDRDGRPLRMVGAHTDVTERKHAEEALRESEARLALVVANVPVGIALFDADGRLTLTNPKLRGLMSDVLPSRDGAAGRRWRTFDAKGGPVAPENWPGSRVLRGEKPGPPVDFLHTREDGSERWLRVVAAPLRRDGQKVAGGILAAQDVTEDLLVQAALRESEERFRSFAENSADVLWIADAGGRRLEYLSPAFERTFGARREPIMADLARWADLVHPDDREAARGFFPRAAAGETAIAHYRVVRPGDGRVVSLRDTGFPIRDEVTGRIARVAGIVQDVTDLARVGAALEAEKERFRTLAVGIPQLVWRAGDEGHWTWASPQWLAFTGQSEAESRGRGWLDAVHPDDRDRALRAWRHAEARGELGAEYRVRRAADGMWRWFQARAVPVRTGDAGEIRSGREWLGASDDIDDLKRLQGQQQVLVAELQHRTRNLLAVVRNVARRSIPSSPERDEYDGRLEALGRVQGFLSRTPDYTVSLRDLVEAELKAAGDGASERVRVEGPPVELPGAGVQPMALALHELATNAVKHGAIGKPSGRLAVTWRLDRTNGGQPRLVLEWRESGVAMPSEGRPERRGYGSELIERALPYQLQAETQLLFTPEGVGCRITLPPGAFRIEEERA